jgi:hypothetical protein
LGAYRAVTATLPPKHVVIVDHSIQSPSAHIM